MSKKIINFVLFIILFLIPLVIFPSSIFTSEYNTPKIFLLYSCGAILFICLLINYKELKLDKTDKILLIFLLLVGISTIFSVNLKKSIFGQSNRFEGLLTFICYFLIYYSGKYFFKFDKKFIIFSLITISITCIIAILQYYHRTFISDLLITKTHGKYFSSSTFGNRNFFGSFMSLCVPYTMCLYIFYKKKIYLVISGFTFYGLLTSLTRSAWLAFFVFSFIGFIYFLKQKNKNFLKRALILLILFIISFVHFLTYRPSIFLEKIQGMLVTINNLNQYFTSDSENINDLSNINNNLSTTTENILIATSESTNENIVSEKNNSTQKQQEDHRILIWKSALKIIKSHPIIGCGPDAYLSELLKNHTQYLTKELYPVLGAYPDKAHNEFLHIAATIGIPAALIYIFFIIITLKNLIKSNLKENKTNFIIFLCLISYLVQAFFNISTIGVAPIFYFLLGYSYQRKTQNNI